MFSKREGILVSKLGAETHGPGRGAGKQAFLSPGRGQENKSPVSAKGHLTVVYHWMSIFHSTENFRNANFNMKYEALSHITVVKTKKWNIIRI